MPNINCQIGDNNGGNDCQNCTFNFTCPERLGLPPCARSGRICTDHEVECLDSKYQTYTMDGDQICKFSTTNANGDWVCTVAI